MNGKRGEFARYQQATLRAYGGACLPNPEGPQHAHADAEREQRQLLREPDNQSSSASESQPKDIPGPDTDVIPASNARATTLARATAET